MTPLPAQTNTSRPEWLNVSARSIAAPSPRLDPALAFDSANGFGVLFGGAIKSNPPCPVVTGECPLGGTWRFAGGIWTNVTRPPPNATPSPRWGAAMAFDPIDGYTLLFGGTNATPTALNSPALGDTWTYSATGWTKLCGTCTPGVDEPVPRWDARLAFDPTDGYLLLFGGVASSGVTTTAMNDTWTFVQGRWTPHAIPRAPAVRSAEGLAFDNQSGSLLLFGGFSSSGSALGDTWSFERGSWAQLSSSRSPSARGWSAASSDPLNGSVLLFGGCGSSSCPGADGDTWTYSLGMWSNLTTTVFGSPSARFGAAAVAEPNSFEILLFGGASPREHNDTWLYSYLLVTGLQLRPDPLDVTQNLSLATTSRGGFGSVMYTWRNLPAGCPALDAPALACAPSYPGVFLVAVNVSSSGVHAWTLGAPLLVNPWPTVVATPALTSGVPPVQVSFAATVSGGTQNFTYNWTFGDGGFASSQFAPHTYFTIGNYTAVVNIQDARGASSSAAVTVHVVPGLTISARFWPTTITLGQVAHLSIAVTGGFPPYNLSVRGGPNCSPPANPTVRVNLTCSPSATGTQGPSITATDRVGNVVLSGAVLVVNPPPAAAPLFGVPPWEFWGLVAVLLAVISALVVVAVFRRRRRKTAPILPPVELRPRADSMYVPPPSQEP